MIFSMITGRTRIFAIVAVMAVVLSAIVWWRWSIISAERERAEAARIQAQNEAFHEKARIERKVEHADSDYINCVLRAPDPAVCVRKETD